MTHLEGTGDAIRKQQATILFSLKDADISIRRRALDLLFAMCDKSIAESVVKVRSAQHAGRRGPFSVSC